MIGEFLTQDEIDQLDLAGLDAYVARLLDAVEQARRARRNRLHAYENAVLRHIAYGSPDPGEPW